MSLADKKWAKLADEQQFKRVENIRSSAANWRTGLIALTALLATVTILKGPEKASGLSDEGRMLAALLLGVALALLLIGSLAAMRAAFGYPGDEHLITGEALREWTANEARTAKRWVKRAVWSFFLAVIAVAGAVGVTWFDGDLFPADPAGVVVVERHSTDDSGETIVVCGELRRITSTSLILQVARPTGERSEPIPLDEVAGVAIESECPE